MPVETRELYEVFEPGGGLKTDPASPTLNTPYTAYVELEADVQHGLRGGGSAAEPLHEVATSTDPGFMAHTDKAKLDDLPTAAQLADALDDILPNVTNDAQLKRSANDFITFTAGLPSLLDALLAENGDDGEKVTYTWTQVIATLGLLKLAGGKMTGTLDTTDGTFQYTGSGGAISINVAAKNDHVQTDSMGGTAVLTLLGGVDGMQGTLFLKQDATGRAVTLAAAGRTAKGSQAIPATPNALVAVGYKFSTVATVAYLFYWPTAMPV